MSRKSQGGRDVEVTLDRRFLIGCVGVLVLVLALGLGMLAGQLRGSGTAQPAAQPAAQFQQPIDAQSGEVMPQGQGQDQLQVMPQQNVPAPRGDELTEQDATGLVAGDVMQDPCFVVNLLEFQQNVVAADFRLTKAMQAEGPSPQLTVGGLNARCGNAYDFGRLEPTEVGQQTFTLTNEGEAPLTVTGLYTSCGCTVAQVEGHELGTNGVLEPPLVLQSGESKDFMVALDAKRVADSAEPRIVQIFSDDPRGVSFGELWPYHEQGQDKELRFAILSEVTMGGTSGGNQ